MMKLYEKNWPQDFTKRFFIGMHMLDKDQNSNIKGMVNNFNARELVCNLADAGCDTVYFYMSCHMGNCYYPTKIKPGRVFSYMKGRDFFGETAAECVKQKIAMVAVYEFINYHFNLKYEDYPRDWHHYRKNRDGHIKARPCWNGGYGDFVLEQIKEVASQYPVAGFYIDMLDYPGRELCPNCIRRFKKEMGRVAPTLKSDMTTSDFKEYKMWTFREQSRYLKRVNTEVQKKIPGAVVLNNYHYLICEDLYEVREGVSYLSTDPTIGYTSKFGCGFSRPTKVAPVFRAIAEGMEYPFDILYDDIINGLIQIIPKDPFMAVAAQALAHGGWPCLDSMWDVNGKLNPAALGLAKAINSHTDKIAKWVGNWKSLKVAGIYLSQETEFNYASPGDKQDRSEHNYMDSFYGALMALEYEHILADVITRRQLCRLSDYKIIYLPNAVCLSDYECEELRKYVANGGTLVASYRSSLANEWGFFRKNFQLADVFGVDYSGVKLEFPKTHQIKFADTEKYPFFPWENPLCSVDESTLKVRLRPDAMELATLYKRYSASNKPGEIPAIRNAFVEPKPFSPGIIENHYGKGRCIYFASKIFSSFLKTTPPELRKITTRWLIKDELSESPVIVKNAPESVKITAFERASEGRWIIHLVNIQSAPGEMAQKQIPIPETLIPIHDLELILNCEDMKIKKISSATSGSEIKFSFKDGRYVMFLEKLKVHEVIVIDFEKTWPTVPEQYLDHDPIKMVHCPVPPKKQFMEKLVCGFNDGWNGLGEGQG